MTQHSHIAASHQLDYERTLILAVEVSGRSWVVAAQVPGLRQKGVKQQLAPRADALMAAVEGYKRRAAAAGLAVERVIVAYESGGSGFWLARWLQQRGVEVQVMQPSSVPVDRRMFAPAPVPERFDRLFPKELMLRPIQLRASMEDAALMTPSVIELEQHYRELTLPVVILTGGDDQIVDVGRQSKRLHQELPQSELIVLPGLGHMDASLAEWPDAQ